MDEAALEKEIGDAQEGLKKRQAMLKVMEEKEAKEGTRSTSELKAELLEYLEKTESITQAMLRLGRTGAAASASTNKKGSVIKRVGKVEREKIERLTEIADRLLSQDKTLSGIYEMSREVDMTVLILSIFCE